MGHLCEYLFVNQVSRLLRIVEPSGDVGEGHNGRVLVVLGRKVFDVPRNEQRLEGIYFRLFYMKTHRPKKLSYNPDTASEYGKTHRHQTSKSFRTLIGC